MLILLAALLMHPFDLSRLAVATRASLRTSSRRRAIASCSESRWKAGPPRARWRRRAAPSNSSDRSTSGCKALDAFPETSARYAEIAIRAAVSAAQEERDELGLLLAHARDLSNQMQLVGSPAQWPLPIDELEGELWLEVDRFTDAREAYERATKSHPTPNAWIGLARASDRLGDVVTACRAYTSAGSTQNLPASVALEISLYALKCGI